ncbi:MAG: Asp-tRNA(Asn)/Glu-tRNA(Gln) amidotransferase subunit GatA [Acidobacteriota bacterium]
MGVELTALSIAELQHGIARRDFSCLEVCDAYLSCIDANDGRIRAFLTPTADQARRQATEWDETIGGGGAVPPLAAVPMALKDNLCTLGIRTTCGSKILENFVAPYDATAVARLRAAGMLLVGKSNCDEFAMGSSTENSAYFATRNPWNLECVPGGSSGGSAAAVASSMALAALGSETGGSVRQPAAFCGILGLKPTYGRVSRYGLVAFASSLDHVSPFARNTADLAAVLQVLAGPDPLDSTSSRQPVPDYSDAMRQDIRGLRIGLPREFFGEGLDPEVREKVQAAARALEANGCVLEEVSLPNTPHAIATYYMIAPAEASSNLARYDGIKYGHRAEVFTDLSDMYRRTRSEGFGTEVKRRIMLGTYALSSGYYDAYYLKASRVRTLIKRDYEQVFGRVDLLLTPPTPTPAFRIGEKAADPLAMYLSDIYTVTANLAGIPAASVPCGLSSEGLPIGMQLLGPHFAEGRILQVAHAYEQIAGFPKWPGL